MAVAVRSDGRRVAHRLHPVRHESAGPGAAIPLVIVMMLTVAITMLVLPSQIVEISLPRTLVPTIRPAAPHRPVDGAAPAAKMSLSTTADPVRDEAEATSDQPALAVGARARVANTDNMGVVFYAAPRDNARQPAGLLEGTTVTVLERSGQEWARVQADSKKAGWVHAQYLVPAE